MMFILAACGSGGGSGGMEMMPAPSQPVMPVEAPAETLMPASEPETGTAPPTYTTLQPVPTQSSGPDVSHLESPGEAPLSAQVNLDYQVFGSWANTILGGVADIIDNNGQVGLRHSAPGNDFKLTPSALRGTHGYIYEGPVIGVHYRGRGLTTTLEGTVSLVYDTGGTHNTVDDGMFVSFSDNLPILTGSIPLPLGLGGNESAIEGEHNGRLYAVMRGNNFINHSATYTDRGVEIDVVKLSGFIQNKRYDGTSVTTGDYYAVGSFTATNADLLTFEGLFAAPGAAP